MRNFYKKLALVLTTFAMFTFIAISQTTVKYTIAEADDDMEEFVSGGTTEAGYMDTGSSDLELGTETAGQVHATGMIWRGVAVPKGATITAASIQFTCDEAATGTGTVLDIYGIKEANTSAPFTSTLFNLSSRPKTSATVSWTPPDWTLTVPQEKGPAELTSDLKTIIQEIVNQSGWASGNNLGLVVWNQDPEKRHQHAEAWEGADDATGTFNAAETAELSITYTAGVAVEKIDASNGLIYPNPSEGKFMVKNPSTGNFGYGIYTMNGSMVRSRDNISGSTTEVDMTKSAKGQYFVIVKSATQTAKSKLILK